MIWEVNNCYVIIKDCYKIVDVINELYGQYFYEWNYIYKIIKIKMRRL